MTTRYYAMGCAMLSRPSKGLLSLQRQAPARIHSRRFSAQLSTWSSWNFHYPMVMEWNLFICSDAVIHHQHSLSCLRRLTTTYFFKLCSRHLPPTSPSTSLPPTYPCHFT